MRTLWPDLLRASPELVATAFALDSVAVELVFIAGPLLVALLTAVATPGVAILVGAGLVVTGTVLFSATPPSRAWIPPGGGAQHGVLGALSSPGIRTLVLTIVGFGFCFGTMEVALPAFGEDHGSRTIAGVLLAVWSLGSAVGGLAYGARQPQSSRPLGDTYVRLAMLLPLGYLPLAVAPSVPVMALLVLPAGVCIAPLLTAGNQLAGEVAPEGTLTEAYTWPITSLVIGIGAGNATAGAIVDAASWHVAFLACAGSGAIGAVLALTRRATLRTSFALSASALPPSPIPADDPSDRTHPRSGAHHGGG
jgi:hypothetical protein